MNKKAIDFRTLTFLLAVIIIAILLIIFYLWQDTLGREVKGKIQVDSDTVHKNHVLIDLLNQPIGEEKTIGDAIAQGELDKACKEAKSMIAWLYGEKKAFTLEFDDDEFCGSDESPEDATKLRMIIPTMDNAVKEVSLEI